MHKFVLAALVAAAAAVGSTPALAADLMTSMSSQRLSSMLQTAGAANVEVTKPEDGVEIVSFSDGGGTIDLVLMDCASGECTTLQMMAIFEKDARFSAQSINSYNTKFLNAKAALVQDGNVMLVDLYVFNGGVTEENFKFNMGIFLQAPELFQTHILSQVTASADTQGKTKPGEAKPAATEASGLKMGIETQIASQSRGLDVLKWLDAKPKRRLP